MSNIISQSFEDLSQSLRVFLESNFRLYRLFPIDPNEAIGNIETTFKAVLDAYHNLYDAIKKELPIQIDWYKIPEVCTILAIRNARHHNLANKIRTIFNDHISNNEYPSDESKYLLIDFPSPKEEGGDCIDFFISWGDIDELLSLPYKESRLPKNASTTVRQYLAADDFEKFASENGLSKKFIFINIVPLLVNAGMAIHPHIKNFINPSSTESDLFYYLFNKVCPLITQSHEKNIIIFSLPENNIPQITFINDDKFESFDDL